jgi:hypothetical protein
VELGIAGHDSQFAQKTQDLSFRGTLRAEESLFVFAFTPGGIPHFLRFTVNVHRERYDEALF